MTEKSARTALGIIFTIGCALVLIGLGVFMAEVTRPKHDFKKNYRPVSDEVLKMPPLEWVYFVEERFSVIEEALEGIVNILEVHYEPEEDRSIYPAPDYRSEARTDKLACVYQLCSSMDR